MIMIIVSIYSLLRGGGLAETPVARFALAPSRPAVHSVPPSRMRSAVWLAWLCACLSACGQTSAPDVVVYTSRQEHLVKPLFDAWERETGQRVAYLTGKAGPLIAKLRAEGEGTAADMLFTVDVGMLWNAAEQGLLRPLSDPQIAAAIPAHLRDTEGRWIGLSVRARAIVYASERVDAARLSTYRALGEPAWHGRLCLRTGKSVYNRSLVAMLIARRGEAEAERVARAWVANLAAAPFASDTQAMQAVIAGQCDVTIVNSYYFGRLQRERQRRGEDLALAIFWPDQAAGEHGVHINVSGAGVTRWAPHPEAAAALLRWLTGSAAQRMLAAANLEYPAADGAERDPLVRAWGAFRADRRHLSVAGARQGDAVRLMDRAGWR